MGFMTGDFETGVTVYSQLVHALNLIHAVCTQTAREPKPFRVGIVEAELEPTSIGLSKEKL